MLIPKSDFVGLEGLTHLAAGGETPMLKSHALAMDRFMADKVLGEKARTRLDATASRCREAFGGLIGTDPRNVALLSSTSEGINLLAHALDWRAGDNVVVSNVEFPSDVLPWTNLRKQGVELRIVDHDNWRVTPENLQSAVDNRTRLVAVSQVSYFTGQRLDMARLSELIRPTGALLLNDATHAAGVVPVQAEQADVVVSSSYKWLLGVHGVAGFYLNPELAERLEPPFLGWHTGVTLPAWQNPEKIEMRPDAARFEPGNVSFLSVYVLENALRTILELGIDRIEEHVLKLSGHLAKEVKRLGFEVMTPLEAEFRAGNVCFLTPNVQRLMDRLADRGILIWGAFGGVDRVRVSTHLYNDSDDVERFLDALA